MVNVFVTDHSETQPTPSQTRLESPHMKGRYFRFENWHMARYDELIAPHTLLVLHYLKHPVHSGHFDCFRLRTTIIFAGSLQKHDHLVKPNCMYRNQISLLFQAWGPDLFLLSTSGNILLSEPLGRLDIVFGNSRSTWIHPIKNSFHHSNLLDMSFVAFGPWPSKSSHSQHFSQMKNWKQLLHANTSRFDITIEECFYHESFSLSNHCVL